MRQPLELADEISSIRRISAADPRIARYERGLPEADRVFTLASQDIRERGWARLCRKEDAYGAALPWRKTESKFRLRPAETTIWAGPNGSKKSLTLNFILAHLAFHGERVFLASLEMTVDDQIARIARQMLCVPHPTRAAYDALMDRLADNLMVYDFVGQLRPERALAVARYAAAELQAQHILVDNLTMIVPPGRDADEKGAKFVAGLYQLGRDHGIHVHLICHVRKPEDPTKMLSRYDIRGTGAAPDQVDNVVIIQVNERKLRAIDGSLESEADGYMIVDKQRHGSFVGRMQFWFWDRQLRFSEDGINPPTPYLV